MTSCTVINHYYDADTDTERYVSTVIEGVFWEDTRAANMRSSGGADGADSISVIIPFRASYIKPFKTPQSYAVDPSESWTLRPGDYIVKDAHLFSFDAAGFREFEKSTDFIHKITKVDTMDFGSKHMQHWEVGGV